MAKPVNDWELQSFFWSHFDSKRTREMGGDIRRFKESFINLGRPPGSSDGEDIEQIAGAAEPPFTIAYVSEKLDEIKSIRGRTYFGRTAQVIDDILGNYPGMRWWMEKGGLVIDTVAPDLGHLSEFDRKAGKLVCDGTQNDRLSAEAVRQIAAELDKAGFILSDTLQPAQWKTIADYNRKYSKKPIKNFAAAVSNPQFVRPIRRRLYVARDRFRIAHNPVPR